VRCVLSVACCVLGGAAISRLVGGRHWSIGWLLTLVASQFTPTHSQSPTATDSIQPQPQPQPNQRQPPPAQPLAQHLQRPPARDRRPRHPHPQGRAEPRRCGRDAIAAAGGARCGAGGGGRSGHGAQRALVGGWLAGGRFDLAGRDGRGRGSGNGADRLSFAWGV